MAAAVRALLQATLLVVCVWTRRGDGYSCPYGEHCLFEPAPPGHVPRCALPGLTYCLHPDPYPDKVIRKLIETGSYDIRTLLSDESPDDFSVTWRLPAARYGPPAPGASASAGAGAGAGASAGAGAGYPYSYGPPAPGASAAAPAGGAGYPYSYGPNSLGNTDQISLVEEPIYIPKPEYNTNFHNSFKQAFFSQKTPLHPPTAGDPYSPSNLPSFHVANFSALNGLRNGYHSVDAPGKIWGQPSINQGQVLNYDAAQTHYNKKLFRQNAFGVGQNDYYNTPQNPFFNNHNFNPKYNLPTNGWVRHSVSGVTPNNPVEWWRYVNPNSRADVTIEQSISPLPPSTTVYYPNATAPLQLGRRRRRHAAQLKPPEPAQLTPAEALRIAFKQASSEAEAERSRHRRQAPNVIQLCQSRSQYITPRAALNNQGNWRYVVNMADNMTQLVKAEICTSSECSGMCSLPLGYTSRCEQKYVQKRLVALQSSGQNLYTDVFWIPSCCQCSIIGN